MVKPASPRVAKTVSNQAQRKAMLIAHAVQESRRDCLPRNGTTQTVQTTYRVRNGNAVVKKVCASVALQVYLYI